jgi:hypothetical protein
MRFFEPLAACALTLACLGTAQPASAAEVDTNLTLSIRDASNHATSVTLECEPTGGTHPHAETACSTLLEANGDFARLRHLESMCTYIYAPVEVRVRGHWRGRDLLFQRTFSNHCIANVDSGGVFGF